MAEKNFIKTMFNDIAPTYDRLNHILSLNIDRIWRKKAVNRIKANNPENVIDLACGTADSTIALSNSGIPFVTGVDISEEMIKVGEKKIDSLKSNSTIFLKVEDCENLSFQDNSFDAAMIAFGIRNFENKKKGLKEIKRVLKANGHLLILELSVPQNVILLSLYKLYFLHIMPFIGGLISGNKKAYKYLPSSVMNFPKPDEFMSLLEECGFKKVSHKALSCGLCRIFEAYK